MRDFYLGLKGPTKPHNAVPQWPHLVGIKESRVKIRGKMTRMIAATCIITYRLLRAKSDQLRDGNGEKTTGASVPFTKTIQLEISGLSLS